MVSLRVAIAVENSAIALVVVSVVASTVAALDLVMVESSGAGEKEQQWECIQSVVVDAMRALDSAVSAL